MDDDPRNPEALFQQMASALALLGAEEAVQKEGLQAGHNTGKQSAKKLAALNGMVSLIRSDYGPSLMNRLSVRVWSTLQRLLIHESPEIRNSAAIALGSAAVASALQLLNHSGKNVDISIHKSGPQSLLNWALPRLIHPSTDISGANLALVAISEFCDIRNQSVFPAVDRFIPRILQSCRSLLEDERTPMILLRPLTHTISVLATKFPHHLRPCFDDMIDLMLGWALEIHMSTEGRRFIADCFFSFRSLWMEKSIFAVVIVTKLLKDMEALGDVDGTSTMTPMDATKMPRLLGLAECFVAVLRGIAEGVKLEKSPEKRKELTSKMKPLTTRWIAFASRSLTSFSDLSWITWILRASNAFSQMFEDNFSQQLIEFVSLLNLCLVHSSYKPDFSSLVIQSCSKLLELHGRDVDQAIMERVLGSNLDFSRMRMHPNSSVVSSITSLYLHLILHPSKSVSRNALACLEKEIVCFCENLGISVESSNTKRLADSVDNELDVISERKHELESVKTSKTSKIEDKMEEAGAGHQRDDIGLELNYLSEKQILSLLKFDFSIICLRFHKIHCQLSGSDELRKSACFDQDQKPLKDSDIFNSKDGISENDKSGQLSRDKSLHTDFLKLFSLFDPIASFYPEFQILLIEFTFKVVERLNIFDCAIENESIVKNSPHPLLHVCIALLQRFMSHGSSLSSKMSCLKCLLQSCAKRSVPFPHSIFNLILKSTLDSEPLVRDKTSDLILVLIENSLVHPSQFTSLSKHVHLRTGDVESEVQKKYIKILLFSVSFALWTEGHELNYPSFGDREDLSLDADLYSKPAINLLLLYFKRDQDQLSAKFQNVIQNSMEIVRPQQTSLFLNFLLQKKSFFPDKWFQRHALSSPIFSLFHPLPPKQSRMNPFVNNFLDENKTILSQDFNLNSGMGFSFEYFISTLCRSIEVSQVSASWFCMHDVARQVILSRLRTHLGSASNTFSSLESNVRKIAELSQNDSIREDVLFSSSISPSSSSLSFLSMRLLLEFMESMDQQILNAVEGSRSLHGVPQPCNYFFRTNHKVCVEWFGRLRESMTHASLALGSHYAAYRHSGILLSEIRSLAISAIQSRSENLDQILSNSKKDVFRILSHCATSLTLSRESDALFGLYRWCVSSLRSIFITDKTKSGNAADAMEMNFGWIKGLALQAEGRHEEALRKFMETFPHFEKCPSEVIQLCVNGVIRNYTEMADWESFQNWLQEFQVQRMQQSNKALSLAVSSSSIDMNSILALSKFDMCDYESSQNHMALIPQSHFQSSVNPHQALQNSKLILLQEILKHRLKESSNSKRRIFDTTDGDHATTSATNSLSSASEILDAFFILSPLKTIYDSKSLLLHRVCLDALKIKVEPNIADSEKKAIQPTDVENDVGVKNILDHLHQAIDTFDLDPNKQRMDDWMWVLRTMRFLNPSDHRNHKLLTRISRLACKQNNVHIAEKLVNGEILLGERINSMDSHVSPWYDLTLIKYKKGKTVESIIDLWEKCYPFVLNIVNSCASSFPLSSSPLPLFIHKSHFKIFKWLSEHSSFPFFSSSSSMGDTASGATTVSLIKSMASLVVEGTKKLKVAKNLFHYLNDDSIVLQAKNANLLMDEICAKILCSSTQTILSPKSWFVYASWVWKIGEKKLNVQTANDSLFLDANSNSTFSDSSLFSFYEIGCNEDDESLNRILKSLGLNLDETLDLYQSIRGIMKKFATLKGIEEDGRNAESLNQLVLQKILNEIQVYLPFDYEKCSSAANALMDTWKSMRLSSIKPFIESVNSFLSFLQYAHSYKNRLYSMNSSLYASKNVSQEVQGTVNSEYDMCLELSIYDKEMNYSNLNFVMTALLHVLHALSSYGSHIHPLIENKLEQLPASIWQEVIPQLFARMLHHPDSVVRSQCSKLLISLANSQPWCLVYPTISEFRSRPLHSSPDLDQLFLILSEKHPQIFHDSNLLILQLESMAVLWEEQLLSFIHDIQQEMPRRFSSIQEKYAEAQKAGAISTEVDKKLFLKHKYEEVMSPLFSSLNRYLKIIQSVPSNPHQVWFRDKYFELIVNAIHEFKKAPENILALTHGWHQLDKIAVHLARNQKKSIPISEISPPLASLKSSSAPIPGLDVHTGHSTSFSTSFHSSYNESEVRHDIVTISSLESSINVISTKTKPKTLAFIGSDGKRYPYLLKGREDLRLDSRIMQLLKSVNQMLRSCRKTRFRHLSARFYSVTPIGPNSGLIQWLEGLNSFYNCYKFSHAKKLSHEGEKKGPNEDKSLKPIELFYSKMVSKLKEMGHSKMIPRKDWSMEAKRKVFLELVKGVPHQLLAREIWCASNGTEDWWLKQKRFSASVAVMSMIGHIIGLGDRHLDNILLDLKSGEIVHIDYNICFEKGLRLRIPEIVPFRLTQTIQSGLGFTGIEGIFRANCEHAMKIFRKNKAHILMLLSVFVWNPLFEWIKNDIKNDEEKQHVQEGELISLLREFSDKFRELHSSTSEFEVTISELIPNLLYQFNNLRTNLDRLLEENSKINDINMRVANLKSIHSNNLTKQSLFRSQRNAILFERENLSIGIKSTRDEILKCASEAKAWTEARTKTLSVLSSEICHELLICEKSEERVAEMSKFSLFSSLLSSGVPLTTIPETLGILYSEADAQMNQSLIALSQALQKSGRSIHSYSIALRRLLPPTYFSSSHVHIWANALSAIGIQSPSPHRLRELTKVLDLLDVKPGDDQDLAIWNKYESLKKRMSNFTSDTAASDSDNLPLARSTYLRDDPQGNPSFSFNSESEWNKLRTELAQFEWMEESRLLTRIPLSAWQSRSSPLQLDADSQERSQFMNFGDVSRTQWWNRRAILTYLHDDLAELNLAIRNLTLTYQAQSTTETKLESSVSWILHTLQGEGKSVHLNGFREMLNLRRQFLLSEIQNASLIARLCTCILEIEASREGVMLNIEREREKDTVLGSRKWKEDYRLLLAHLQAYLDKSTDIESQSLAQVEESERKLKYDMEKISKDLNEVMKLETKSKEIIINSFKSYIDTAKETKPTLDDAIHLFDSKSDLLSNCIVFLEQVANTKIVSVEMDRKSISIKSMKSILVDVNAHAISIGDCLRALQSNLLEEVTLENHDASFDSKIHFSNSLHECIQLIQLKNELMHDGISDILSKSNKSQNIIQNLYLALQSGSLSNQKIEVNNESEKDSSVPIKEGEKSKEQDRNIQDELEILFEGNEKGKEKARENNINYDKFSNDTPLLSNTILESEISQVDKHMSNWDEYFNEDNEKPFNSMENEFEKSSLENEIWESEEREIDEENGESDTEHGVYISENERNDEDGNNGDDDEELIFNPLISDQHNDDEFSGNASILGENEVMESVRTGEEPVFPPTINASTAKPTILVGEVYNERVDDRGHASEGEIESEVEWKRRDMAIIDNVGKKIEAVDGTNPKNSFAKCFKGKNSQAMSILKRVEEKLEGKEIASQTLSVEDQVNSLIQQACSVDNLCNMYEGWMPWI